MNVASTRGGTAELPLGAALLGGTAPDGGLFVPATFPRGEVRDPRGSSLADSALAVLGPFFAEDALERELPAMVAEAFTFPAPLVPLRSRGDFVLELFHGPTASFKDCGARFLAACVRAGKSIVVSGVQGSGKTTWVRALCSCIPPWEMIGTFETEFELHLHELVDRHKIVHAWEHRPGSGEVGIDGRQAGEFSLEEAIHHSFRFNLARQIVGEVRGPEVWNMLKAMESGPGSISTTHARSAEHTIEKLVSCAMEKGPQVTRELAISKLAAAIDIVMYLRSEVVPNGDGTFRKQRWVEEVMVVQPSIDAARGYATTPIFAPNQLGQAVATGKLDNFLAQELARHGFDLEAYKAESQANPGVATS